jgi:hypothetical protein
MMSLKDLCYEVLMERTDKLVNVKPTILSWFCKISGNWSVQLVAQGFLINQMYFYDHNFISLHDLNFPQSQAPPKSSINLKPERHRWEYSITFVIHSYRTVNWGHQLSVRSLSLKPSTYKFNESLLSFGCHSNRGLTKQIFLNFSFSRIWSNSWREESGYIVAIKLQTYEQLCDIWRLSLEESGLGKLR